jgi:hypothetical protein
MQEENVMVMPVPTTENHALSPTDGATGYDSHAGKPSIVLASDPTSLTDPARIVPSLGTLDSPRRLHLRCRDVPLPSLLLRLGRTCPGIQQVRSLVFSLGHPRAEPCDYIHPCWIASLSLLGHRMRLKMAARPLLHHPHDRQGRPCLCLWRWWWSLPFLLLG